MAAQLGALTPIASALDLTFRFTARDVVNIGLVFFDAGGAPTGALDDGDRDITVAVVTEGFTGTLANPELVSVPLEFKLQPSLAAPAPETQTINNGRYGAYVFGGAANEVRITVPAAGPNNPGTATHYAVAVMAPRA